MESAPAVSADPASSPDAGAGRDVAFLSLVVLLSLVLYVRELGFYSDDWTSLAAFRLSGARSLSGLFLAVYGRWVWMRPVQELYAAGLYRLFGAAPLGYHLVNGLVLLAGCALFYLVLRRLGLPRLPALASALVYALLPHYSTDRFWFSAFQATLSMALYFLSLYAALRAAASARAGRWGWRLLSLAGLLGSTLAYEVFLPLFFLTPVLAWYGRGLARGVAPDGSRHWTAWAARGADTWLSLGLVLLFKARTTVRMEDDGGLVRHFGRIAKAALSPTYGPSDYGFNLKEAVLVNYGSYGLGLPRTLWLLWHDSPNVPLLALAGGLALVIFGYLSGVARRTGDEWADRALLRRLVIGGLITVGAGYAIFLTNRSLQFTPTGIANRTAIAPAVGVALSLVGALGWLSACLPRPGWRPRLFCGLAALLAASGFLILNLLALYWAGAYRQERAILAGIRRRVPTLAPGSALILDGVCPYRGPAIVFESSWDLAGALKLSYGDPTLAADVVTPRLTVDADGLSTETYGYRAHYGYGKLLLYDARRGRTYRLTDAAAARRYFRTFSPDRSGGCPPGHEGLGVPLF